MQPDLPNLPYAKLLSAKEVGAEFGVDEDTVLRWWHQGLPTGKGIPHRFMRRRGFCQFLFHPEIVTFIRQEQVSLD